MAVQNGSERPRTKSTLSAPERVIVIGVYGSKISSTRRLDELKSLVFAAHGAVVFQTTQRRPSNVMANRPLHPATYIGRGKAEELADLVVEHEATTVVFDHELSPAQIRELEKMVGCRVVDRSELILDIFASRAKTREARLQVELAQLQYTAPRLRGMWSHLARQAGQSGSAGIATRGPGEQQLEIDRRLVDKRILLLKSRLSDIESRRERLVQGRSQSSWGVGLVGYTNAGKSTLLNALTSSHAFVADQLFATLDTVSRRWEVSPGVAIPLSDTVGFVRDLPHHLVTGFRSTLAEALHASLLLHVVDASHPDALEQIEVVHEVLTDLKVDLSQVVGVLNKCDAVSEPSTLVALKAGFQQVVEVSALGGEGLDTLATVVASRRSDAWKALTVVVPHSQAKLVAMIHEQGKITEQRWTEEGWHAEIEVPRHLIHRLTEVVV